MSDILKKLIKTSPDLITKKIFFKLKKKAYIFLDNYMATNHNVKYVLENYASIEKNRLIADVNITQKEVNKILNNQFSFLGVNSSDIKDLKWNCDFVSGYQWENKYFQHIQTVNLEKGIDVKIPWELSRFQHISFIVSDYLKTKNERCLSYIKNSIINWIETNPYKHSVNWTCAMEVGIRAVNMVYISILLSDEFQNDKPFLDTYIDLLYKHSEYIEQNLETYDKYYNNHYLSDLLGMLCVGLYLNQFADKKTKKKCAKWVKFANLEFEKELYKQVFGDGTNYESSIAYHRFVTEIYMWYVFWNEFFGNEVKQEIKNKINSMLSFMTKIQDDNGCLPLIGDNDDGRIIILENYYDWNRRGYDFLLKRKKQLLSGDLSLVNEVILKETLTSVSYPDSGYYVLRNKAFYCMLHCGQLSMHGHGGHSHNDQLAIILSVLGKDFFVDAGSGTYTRNKQLRNEFRSTMNHNTLQLGRYEQNDIEEDRLFELPEQTFSKAIKFEENYFEGEHYGYSNLGIVHNRKVEIKDKCIILIDSVEGLNGKDEECKLNFVLDKCVIASKLNSKEAILKKHDVTIKVTFECEFNIVDTKISYSYGSIEDTLKLETEAFEKEQIITKIEILEEQQ